MNKYGYTLDQDERFYIDTVISFQYAFTLLASKFVIDFVQKHIEPRARNLDAIFDSLPDGFYQLLIVTIEYRNDVSIIFKVTEYQEIYIFG